ncbi:MAG: HAD-IA family hydrolase [Acidobacteriota bacterium]
MTEFIFFDTAGTLLCPFPSVGRIYAAAGRPHGLEVEPKRIDGAFRTVWRKRMEESGDDLLRAGRNKDATREWWRGIVFQVLREVGFQGDREACFDACHKAFGKPSAWRIYDDVFPALEELRHRRASMGILSNWDYRLPSLLAGLGLVQYFEPILVSSLEGMRKPDPAFFKLAIQRAGVAPGAILHVGDQLALDLEPARRMGMQACLIDRTRSKPRGRSLIHSLSEVARMFGH